MSLGIVVPAYRPNVGVLASYVRALDERIAPETIRIELDAAEPDAVDALRELPATVNAVSGRRGKGAAITAGFEALETEVLAFVDADGATPVESVAAIVAPVVAGEVPMAVGSRRHPDSDVEIHQGFLRRFLGDGFAWLARRVVGPVGTGNAARLYDYQCGAKALTAEAWAEVRRYVYQPGFAWDLELVAVAAARGVAIREVPVLWEDKPGSTVAPVRDALSMFVGLLLARHRAKVAGGNRLHRRLADDAGPSLAERAIGGAKRR